MNDHAYFLFARPAEALTVPVSPTPRTVPPRNPKPATTAGAAAPQETTSRATPEQYILQELGWQILGQVVMMLVLRLPPTMEAVEMRRAAMAPAVSVIWIVPKSLRSEVPEST